MKAKERKQGKLKKKRTNEKIPFQRQTDMISKNSLDISLYTVWSINIMVHSMTFLQDIKLLKDLAAVLPLQSTHCNVWNTKTRGRADHKDDYQITCRRQWNVNSQRTRCRGGETTYTWKALCDYKVKQTQGQHSSAGQALGWKPRRNTDSRLILWYSKIFFLPVNCQCRPSCSVCTATCVQSNALTSVCAC